jgi:threonine synthase
MEVGMIDKGLLCTSCGRAYPSTGVPYRCPVCGGLYDYYGAFLFDHGQVEPAQPGIWRFQHAFGLPSDLEPVSLGEGNTPLIWAKVFDRQVAFKCEFLNPSGSFKDRGSAVITAWLKYKGVSNAIEDSSGNAGSSFAAYAARAGIKARIFVPDSASGPKRRQIEVYGAELIRISGSRSEVSEAARKFAEAGKAYASHAYLPFNLAGYATTAYELFEQLGQMPGSVLVPAGQGGLLLGLARGFDALRIGIGIISGPIMVGVQARACSPLWRIFASEKNEPDSLEDQFTLAEGVRVLNPLRKDEVLAAVRGSCGFVCVTDEDQILPGRDALAALGFYVEPTSAIVWAALERIIDKMPDPVVVILTGTGLKYE